MNFSSDHVEPIKADHGTQPPPPTSSTFFVLSLFLPRVLAFIHPPPRGERERGKEKERSLSRMPFPSRSRASPLSTTPVPVPTLLARASSFHLVFLLLPRPLTHSGNSLDFFASRGGVIYLAEVERHPRRWSTKRARGWVAVARGYEGGRGRIGGGAAEVRRHRGGGDAARMRARGIEPERARAGVARGWFQFILWVLPTRSSLSNPVGQSVCCVLSLSLRLSLFLL